MSFLAAHWFLNNFLFLRSQRCCFLIGIALNETRLRDNSLIIGSQCELNLLIVSLFVCQFEWGFYAFDPIKSFQTSLPSLTPLAAPSPSFSSPSSYSFRNQLLWSTRLPSHPGDLAPPPIPSSYPSDNKKGILSDQGDGKSVCESLGSCHFLISHCVAVLTGVGRGVGGGRSAGPWSRLGKQWQQRWLRPP